MIFKSMSRDKQRIYFIRTRLQVVIYMQVGGCGVVLIKTFPQFIELLTASQQLFHFTLLAIQQPQLIHFSQTTNI